jgi:hypothetical protein
MSKNKKSHKIAPKITKENFIFGRGDRVENGFDPHISSRCMITSHFVNSKKV